MVEIERTEVGGRRKMRKGISMTHVASLGLYLQLTFVRFAILSDNVRCVMIVWEEEEEEEEEEGKVRVMRCQS